MGWFDERFGIRPKKANDPLRLGRSRRSKRVLMSSLAIGALLVTYVQVKGSTSPGSQTLQSYIEVRAKKNNHWSLRDLIPCATVVFLTSGTSGTTSVTFPNWDNANNFVEVIGGGTNGSVGSACLCFGTNTGGTGGGYAKKANVVLGSTYTYAIAAAGGTTSFNSVVSASTVFVSGDSGFSGGAGGSSTAGWGSGGGGAAGLHGAGNPGQGGFTFNAGGSGDAGFGGAAGASSSGAGGAGAEWSATAGGTAGAGGGGGAGGSTPGANGGLYGGGGGSGCNASTAAGSGRQGIVFVTYIPLIVPLAQILLFPR